MVFQDLPIKRKVTVVIMLTSVAVLLLSTAAFVLYDFVTYRQTMVRNVSALAAIFAERGALGLETGEWQQAEQLLSALHEEPNVQSATFYDPQNRPLAWYPQGPAPAPLPPAWRQPGHWFQDGRLYVLQPVFKTHLQLGNLLIQSHGRPLYDRLRLYSALALAVLAASVLTALLLAQALQRHITEPILALADTVRRITEHHDFSLRAPKRGADEMGFLTDSFNQMLARLQASEDAGHFLAAIVVSSDAAIVGKDLQGRVLSWNVGAERLFGYTAAEMIGQPITRLVASDRPDEEMRILREVKRGEIRHFETVRMHKEGRPVAVGLTVSPIYGDQGKVIGVSSIARDITARKQAEEQIRRMNLELEQRVQERTAELTSANRELEAFTYSVAHDLRAPLRHVESFSKILCEDYLGELSPEAARYLESIRQSSRHMNQLVDDLLNLARVGRLELKRQQVPLNRLVQEVVAELKRESEGRVIEWRLEPLPELSCDPGLMKLVFVNLLSNAVKYTRPRPHALIEVGTLGENGTRIFFVRDNGVGFNMKYVKKLFGVFQRLHRADEFEGTGVGLATVERIVRKHGGQVWAEGAVEHGATFYFTIAETNGETPNPQEESLLNSAPPAHVLTS